MNAPARHDGITFDARRRTWIHRRTSTSARISTPNVRPAGGDQVSMPPCIGFDFDAGRIACWSLSGRVQGLQERDEGTGLCGIQIPPVRGHVAAALNDLTDELISRETDGNGIERGSARASGSAQRVTVAALLVLEHERALTLERRSSLDISRRNRFAAPRV